MSSRVKLSEVKEPKIFKSLKRIAEYYIRASKYITRYTKDYTQEIIYSKVIVKLPDAFSKDVGDFTVLKVSNYALQDNTLWRGSNGEINYSLKTMYSKLELECHISKEGTLLAAYAVL